MRRALFALGATVTRFREWWRDAVFDRVVWLVTDLRGSSTTAWDGPTDEWLPQPRRKLGSSR